MINKVINIFFSVLFSVFITFVISLIIVSVMLFFLVLVSQQAGGDLGALSLIVAIPAVIIFLMAILTPFVYRKITNPSKIKLELPELYNRGSLKRIIIYLLIGLAILLNMFRDKFFRIF